MWANLSTIEEVRKAVEDLSVEEEKGKLEVEQLLEVEDRLESDLRSLYKQCPNTSLLHSDASQLANMINFTATLAGNVSAKVRRLDLAKTRASQCLQRIGDILDLKFCTQGIQSSLANEDFEQAAAHIHRFLSMDESVLRRSAADESDSLRNGNGANGNALTASSMDEAFSKLHEAERRLKDIVMKRFDEAVKDDDVASVERFFKIFPLINQHQEGLRKFSNYLCTKISDKVLIKPLATGAGAAVSHPEKLSQLYETIAKIVDIHQPLVETYYGHGNLVYVIQSLQRECDRQSKRILLEFKAKKSFVQTVSLVQKAFKSSSLSSTNKIDPRETDQLLSEITLVNSRSETYLRFIHKRASSDIDLAFPETTSDRQEREERLNLLNALVRNCELSLSIQELNGTYVLLEEYFLRESCVKAIQLDEADPRGTPTSSMLDDVFFILKKCIKRASSGGSLDVLCAIINHSVSVLDTSFCDALNDRLRYGYPSAATITGAAAALDLSQAYNALQAGRYLQSSSDIEKAKRLYLTAVNNLDVSCDYIKTLRTNIKEEVKRSMNLIDKKQQQEKLESCLSDLTAVTGKFQSLTTYGLGQLCSSSLKPRIKTWVDAFTSCGHILSEDDLNGNEATEGLRPFTQNFIINVDILVTSLKDNLTANNFDTLLSIFSTELTNRLEKAVMKCSYNKLGGFQFDRELRAIVSYLTSSTSWSIRDKFSRLKQISMVLNMDSVGEVSECFNSNLGTGSSLTVTPNELRKITKLRTDFSPDDIRKMKL